jgi:hypothetical protein
MSEPILIGHATGGRYRAAPVDASGPPEVLRPVLRRIWAATHGRDTTAMTQVLERRHWQRLDPDACRGHRVPGVGVIHAGGNRPAHTGTVTERITGPAGWLYLLEYRWRAMAIVYEATLHQRWLRHSIGYLDPAGEEMFVPEFSQAHEATVCTVCGAVDEIDVDDVPSMTGYGYDTTTRCRRCGSSLTTGPGIGTTVHRAAWPPPADTPPAPRQER